MDKERHVAFPIHKDALCSWPKAVCVYKIFYFLLYRNQWERLFFLQKDRTAVENCVRASDWEKYMSGLQHFMAIKDKIWKKNIGSILKSAVLSRLITEWIRVNFRCAQFNIWPTLTSPFSSHVLPASLSSRSLRRQTLSWIACWTETPSQE